MASKQKLQLAWFGCLGLRNLPLFPYSHTHTHMHMQPTNYLNFQHSGRGTWHLEFSRPGIIPFLGKGVPQNLGSRTTVWSLTSGLSPSSATSWVTLIGHLMSHCLNFVNRKMKMIQNSCTQHHPFPCGVIIVKIKWTNTNTASEQVLASGHHGISVSYSYHH